MNLRLKHRIIATTAVTTALPVLVMSSYIWYHKGGLREKILAELIDLSRQEVGQISQDMANLCQTADDLAQQRGDSAGQSAARDAILGTKVGKSGYVYVLGGNGEDRGHYIISKDGQRDGEDIWSSMDSDGNLFIQSMVNKALALRPGEVAFERYPWKNQGEARPRMKIAALTYYEPWDWVIGAGTYEDDYFAAEGRVAAALGKMQWSLLASGLVVMAIAIFLGARLASGIGGAMRQMTQAAAALANGDIRQGVDHCSTDEIGELADSLRTMMKSLVGKALWAEQIAKGDLTAECEVASEHDVLGNAMLALKRSIAALVELVNRLATAAKEGCLSTRADAARLEGEFRAIVEGMNMTLDRLSAPINEASQVLQRVATRDLSVRMTGEYRGDFAVIKQAVNTAVQNLDEAMRQVTLTAEQVASAAVQISSGSQSLSQGASEQASSLEEISSSLQELSGMTKQTAANAKEVRSLSDGARTSSEKGVQSMRCLSESIDKIKASSDATARILKAIDEIAFQTNLLALNAAVEAARAGDAGKGFAVVAAEVRNLAMHSAQAAKDTAALIEEAVKNAEGGVVINNEVLKNLDDINTQIRKVSEAMAEIVQASDQQSQGMEQISTAVDQMNQVTQQVAAGAEESASTSQELSAQASDMRGMVNRFRFGGDPRREARDPAGSNVGWHPDASAVDRELETIGAKS